jgi:phosphonate transport system permease protein
MMAHISRPNSGIWPFPHLVTASRLLWVAALCILLLWSGRATEMDRAFVMTGQAIHAAATGQNNSQVVNGFSQIAESLWPMQLESRIELHQQAGQPKASALPFSHIETTSRSTQSTDPLTGQAVTTSHTKTELVVPYGYVLVVVSKLIETIQMAIWATLIALVISLPLGFLAARNLMGDGLVVGLARSLIGLLRAIPELVSALFFVVAFGFGPIAGIFALGLHAAGFLGKFFADDSENADPKPQEALVALGANTIKVARFAVLPQVLPQYIAYILYILDRNIRMATVIGLVGAGGIGQELKGRFDMYDYGHVATILVAIFILVVLVDQLSASIRKQLL